MKPRQLRLLLIIGVAAMIVSVVAFIGMSQLMQSVNERKERREGADAVLGTLTWDDILAQGGNPAASPSAEASEPDSTAAAEPSGAVATESASQADEGTEPSASAEQAETLAPAEHPVVFAGGGLVPYDDRKFIVSDDAVPEAGFAKVITVTRADRPLIAQDITWEMDVGDSDDVHVTAHGRRLSDKENIATGMLVELYDGDNVIDTAVIVVPGDVTGSGTVDASQIEALEKAVSDPAALQGAYFLAGDLDGSGTIDDADLLMLHARVGA